MQTIERYGVIVLLLVAVSIGAVYMFESDPADGGAAAASAVDQAQVASGGSRSVQAAGRNGSSRSTPITRPGQTQRSQSGFSERRPSDNTRIKARTSAPVFKEKFNNTIANAGDMISNASTKLAQVGQSASSKLASQFSGSAGSTGKPSQTRSGMQKVPLSLSQKPTSQNGGSRTTRGRRGSQTAKAQPAVVRSSGSNLYVVQAGDTLGHISQRMLGTTKRWKDIADLNPDVEPSRIVVGMKLRLPTGAASKASTTKSGSGKSSTAKLRKNQVRVAEGESLWTIAARVLGDGSRFNEIAKLNPSINPDRVVTGQVLTVPVGDAALPRKKSTSKSSTKKNVIAKNTPRKKSKKVL